MEDFLFDQARFLTADDRLGSVRWLYPVDTETGSLAGPGQLVCLAPWADHDCAECFVCHRWDPKADMHVYTHRDRPDEWLYVHPVHSRYEVEVALLRARDAGRL